jgi:hypothetical protein
MEFRDGKVARETQYFVDTFDPPPWRAEWVEQREREIDVQHDPSSNFL